MAKAMRLADQVAASDASVLITGESGTGKELMARYLHRKSHRSDRPFVSVNCAAIPDNLLESELFGHEKGAFTGAVARRVGKFEEAHGGTLLLDEISEMEPRLQAKLLRAIQEREIDRVGGTQPVKVDIRVLATSNRNLEQQVTEGAFREDLYFRLNVVNILLPPLRDRPQDIAQLTVFFDNKYAQSNSLPDRPVAPEAVAKLQAHHWRGNVRELENTIHRAVLLAGGDVIDCDAVILSGQSLAAPEGARPPVSSPQTSPLAPPQSAGRPVEASEDVADGAQRGLVCRTVAEVERDLILENAAAHIRQPHPRRQHSRHFDPHAAQQAQAIHGRRHLRSDARRAGARLPVAAG